VLPPPPSTWLPFAGTWASIGHQLLGWARQLPTGWAEAKKLWCCRHERKGCVHITFDCNAGRDKWETGWSQEKILQCCGVDHSGCPAGSSTVIPPYDCEAGWVAGVPPWGDDPAKQAWCCIHENKGCTATTANPAGIEKWPTHNGPHYGGNKGPRYGNNNGWGPRYHVKEEVSAAFDPSPPAEPQQSGIRTIAKGFLARWHRIAGAFAGFCVALLALRSLAGRGLFGAPAPGRGGGGPYAALFVRGGPRRLLTRRIAEVTMESFQEAEMVSGAAAASTTEPACPGAEPG
jgi:hypothetical protein